MSKIRRISEFQGSISYQTAEENFQNIYDRFLSTKLGGIYQSVPWKNLVGCFDLKESAKGPNCIFSPRGKLALMFLKHYACCSDQRLIEQLNANVHYQIFCDILLSPGEEINNFKIVSQIRCELAEKLNIESSQKCLASFWFPYINNPGHAVVDATCYESEMRFPTNQKLLWECVDWLYSEMKLTCKYLKLRMPRTKFLKWRTRWFAYSRKRRKPSKEKRVLTRALLGLLEKLIFEMEKLEKDNCLKMPSKYYSRMFTIQKVLAQQKQLFFTGEKPQNRIVSISKSYIRPIVRGKEIKKVEFGAKANKIQIDGISFIEHLNFDAFNEGTRFKSSVGLTQELMHTKLTIMGADAIFATNANRKFATGNNICTDFCRKGRAGKHEAHRKKLAAMITKERTSRLEGSFGKEKEHYHLKKIKARKKETEVLWIFFGIHTANAIEIGRRIQQKKNQKIAV